MKGRRPVVDERVQVDEFRFHEGAINVDANVLARVIDERKDSDSRRRCCDLRFAIARGVVGFKTGAVDGAGAICRFV